MAHLRGAATPQANNIGIIILTGIGDSEDRVLGFEAGVATHECDRSVDVRIARLRRKVEDNPAHPQIIRTVRNIGYLLISGS